jgi:hypothetical protein
MRIRALNLALIAALAAVPSLARAGAWSLARGEYYSELEAGRSVADTYLDANGGRQSAAAVLESRSLRFYNEFGWKKSMSWVLAAPIESRTGRIGSFSRTQTGLGDLHVGLRYKLKNGVTGANVQLDWVAPLGYDATYAVPPLGDGLQSLGLRLNAGRAFGSRGFAEASGGYRIRYKGAYGGQKPVGDPDYKALSYQKQGTWSARAGWWVGSSLLVLGHYDGFGTLDNGDALGPGGDNAAHVVGPELRYRVDDRMDVYAGSYHVATGRNVAHPDEYYVGFAFRSTKLTRTQGVLGNKSRP